MLWSHESHVLLTNPAFRSFLAPPLGRLPCARLLCSPPATQHVLWFAVQSIRLSYWQHPLGSDSGFSVLNSHNAHSCRVEFGLPTCKLLIIWGLLSSSLHPQPQHCVSAWPVGGQGMLLNLCWLTDWIPAVNHYSLTIRNNCRVKAMRLFCQNTFKGKVFKENLRWLNILHKNPNKHDI